MGGRTESPTLVNMSKLDPLTAAIPEICSQPNRISTLGWGQGSIELSLVVRAQFPEPLLALRGAAPAFGDRGCFSSERAAVLYAERSSVKGRCQAENHQGS